ncbi:hypothetical protein LTR16_003934 [Cryomyces antarcticus]|uniref:Xylanolytic transcriptional activator regulatory domain-containing protein n=1 Tax=Cryomyces antarcticus TaxID=329879 RepID=A0ABR0LPU4_9PEZI|nr:hypothetical protein LTR16_003934 [Cryomyces antarcticus]
MPSHYFIAPSTNFSSDSPSISSSPMNDSARHSSVTSVSTESITDATRQALLLSLSQPSVFSHNHRKYSQPAISSPLSPGFGPRSASYSAVLPSTADLQRYVSAYIQYFHPHLPFLHISTLSFDSPDYISNLRTSSGYTGFGHSGIVGGGGCLILAMAAIGALYEYDHVASKDLFEAAKKMIQLYLEERRKADMSAAVNGANLKNENTTHNTPLWLVQAMLLNVIYGHQCGDKTAADIASTHCAALVSLARAAELAQPSSDSSETPFGAAAEEPSHFKVEQSNGDVEMDEDSSTTGGWKAGTQAGALEEHAAWCRWKIVEERKRTLFAVFILSSLLVTAYNHTPAIMNSEILLDLPCEEDLWAADSAQAWAAKGGTASMENNVSFAAALSRLLTANQRQQSSYSLPSTYHQRAGSSLPTEDLPESELKPSTFGCLVLINALHNYIWETRSRHHGRQWTTQETESMLSHIEPALKAWQSAWAANPHHKLERPNPFGFGPLSADSIPLLDLAFVRLFVNLGRSKEAFWQRDFETMADELARGAEIAQHAEQSPLTLSEPSDSSGTTNSSSSCPSAATSPSSVTASVHGQTASHKTPPHMSQSSQSSRRERHLRKAAFYAADSLGMAEKLNNTYADFTSRELPIQSAMCFFDCAQVLAEWASTLQERVGRYLGVLGKDEIDYTQVPAIMLLESEDVELLRKISEILGGMETKILDEAKMMAFDIGGLDPNGAINAMNNTMTTLPGISGCGYGSKTLMVTAYMLEKAAVWPVTHVMARALETQAAHMNQRAEASLAAQ